MGLSRPALVAVDGVDGSGKTTFASHLAAVAEAAGRPSLVVHEDDFLAPRGVRYRLGRDSPEGFFRDSYDLDALASHLVVTIEGAPADAVVIVEGLFLHRDELHDRWDWSVFLDVPSEESVRRWRNATAAILTPPTPRCIATSMVSGFTWSPADRVSARR